MVDWSKAILDWLKESPNAFTPLLLASCFGLFAPLETLKSLGVDSMRTEHQFYLGLVFVLSLCIVGWGYVAKIAGWLNNKYRVFLSRRAAHGRLKLLSADEKRFLAGYLKEDSHIQWAWIHSPVAATLRTEGILYAAVEQGMTDNFPFTISLWAWKYLKKNPHLVHVEGV